jgi:membrane associated rhomboid family serine protease
VALAVMYGLQKLRPGLTPLLYKCNAGLAQGQLHRLVTSGLLHGSTMHLAVNTWSLSNLGPSCERWFGKPRFCGVVLASGVGAALLSWRFVPGPSLGASGAVFGLLGAWAVFLAENREVLGRDSTSSGLESIARTIGLNAALGLFMPGIDHFGHAGGFVAGAACGFLLGPRLRVRERKGLNGFVYDRVLVDYPRLPSACRDVRFGAEWLRWRLDKSSSNSSSSGVARGRLFQLG